MLKSITLTFTESGKLILPAEGITIFVGPNNSGKSLILKEIDQIFDRNFAKSDVKIIDDYDIDWPDRKKIDLVLERMPYLHETEPSNSSFVMGFLNPLRGFESTEISRNRLHQCIERRDEKRWFATEFLRFGALRLDGRSRFSLTDDRPAGDLLSPASNVLMHLLQDDAARLKIRKLVKDAFGLHFVIDPTNLGTLRIRLSSEPPKNELSIDSDSREFYRNASHIKNLSDGVQAFTGILTAVCSGQFHTILVDEPEAFLHPPLARKLGKSLASIAGEMGCALFAATHSADFLMGCIQSSENIRVVRLEYSNGKSRARMIDSKSLVDFLRIPMMRSSNIISGLFYDGVIICESDNDRAFYNEIYIRLNSIYSELPSILFVNAQNKQTIKDLMEPLRQCGVPVAAIVDLDIVKDGGMTWTGWLKAAQIPIALQLGYGQQRSAINEVLKSTGKNMKIHGIDILDKDDKSAAENLLDNLENYGIFTVRRGELEKWLPKLEVPGKKTDWSIAMLTRLGSDPTDPNYILPENDDVWEFIRKISDWIRNPARKGTV